MKSIDTYLCKEKKKVFSFNFCDKDYFIGDKLTSYEANLLLKLAKGIAPIEFIKAIKIDRFACNRYVDCAL